MNARIHGNSDSDQYQNRSIVLRPVVCAHDRVMAHGDTTGV